MQPPASGWSGRADTERVVRAWLAQRPALRGALRLLLIGAGLWLILTSGQPPGLIGLLVIVSAIWAGTVFGSQTMYPWRPLQLLLFIGYFLRGSLLGGVDVALRALRPNMPIEPCFVRYVLNVPAGKPRTLLVTAISLMPGTLSVDLQGDELLVHLLSPEMSTEIESLEYRVGRLLRAGEGEHFGERS